MKKLTITVLVVGLFTGSLFAAENNMMMCKKRKHLNTVSENTWTVFTLLFEH